jgi:hypothetical protein
MGEETVMQLSWMFGSFGIIVIVRRVAVHHWDYKIKKWMRLNVVLWNNYVRSNMSVSFPL